MSRSSRSSRRSCTSAGGPTGRRSSGTPRILRCARVALSPRFDPDGCRWKSLTLPSPFSAREGDREIARCIGPPATNSQPGVLELALNPLASELRAHLAPEPLALLESELELQPPDTDNVRLAGAEADVHPLL